MSKCCGKPRDEIDLTPADPSALPETSCCGFTRAPSRGDPPPPSLTWFDDMVSRNIEYAAERQREGAKVVGIMCEYTPREIIMAAGGVPVCLCGGDGSMIPAAEELLPANLCPLIKSTFGFSLNRANPLLEMADLLVAETTCDGKKKMYEHLGERHPMVVLELPQRPDSPDGFERWVHELDRLRRELEGRFGVTVTDDDLRRAIREMNGEREKRRRLAGLMAAGNPPLTGLELLQLKSLISCIPADLEQYDRALTELEGRSVFPPDRPPVRVLVTGVPMPHGQERVMALIEEHGGIVVAQENCTGIKPIYEDVDPDAADPLRAIAEKYFHLPCSVMVGNAGRLELLQQLTETYRPDCIIELIWQACITYDVESVHVRRFAEETLRLPYLRIETDYSPSDSARIGLRVQALFEMAR